MRTIGSDSFQYPHTSTQKVALILWWTGISMGKNKLHLWCKPLFVWKKVNPRQTLLLFPFRFLKLWVSLLVFKCFLKVVSELAGISGGNLHVHIMHAHQLPSPIWQLFSHSPKVRQLAAGCLLFAWYCPFSQRNWAAIKHWGVSWLTLLQNPHHRMRKFIFSDNPVPAQLCVSSLTQGGAKNTVVLLFYAWTS